MRMALQSLYRMWSCSHGGRGDIAKRPVDFFPSICPYQNTERRQSISWSIPDHCSGVLTVSALRFRYTNMSLFAARRGTGGYITWVCRGRQDPIPRRHTIEDICPAMPKNGSLVRSSSTRLRERSRVQNIDGSSGIEVPGRPHVV